MVPEYILEIMKSYKKQELSLPTVGKEVPVFNGFPCLLLHQLGIDHSDLLEKAIHKASRSHGLVILAGTSGCGKTRTLYNYCSKNPSLYFTTTTKLNGGSHDVTQLLQMLGSLLKKGCHRKNKVTVKFFVLLLLAARMAILKKAQEIGLSDKEWLIFQAASRGLEGSHIDRAQLDVFSKFFVSIVDVVGEKINLDDEDCLNDAILSLSRKAREKLNGLPTTTVDEAQALITEYPQDYFKNSSGEDRPLFSVLVETMQQGWAAASNDHVLVMSGTGYALLFQPMYIGSHVAKMGKGFEGVTGLGFWQESGEMLDYARTATDILDSDEVVMRKFLRKMRGRFRPFVSAIEYKIHTGCSLEDACKWVISALTTKVGDPKIKGNYYKIIEELAARPCIVNGVNLMEILKVAVVSYYLRRRNFAVADEAHIEALQSSLAMVVSSNEDQRIIEIWEFLVMEGAMNYFMDVRVDFLCKEVLMLMANDVYSSSQGFTYQYFVPLAFQLMWARANGIMQDMPLLESVMSDAPESFLQLAKEEGKFDLGEICVYKSDEKYKVEQFLCETPGQRKCTTLICEESAGRDSCSTISYPKCSITILHQCKLWNKSLSPKEMRKAVLKSCLKNTTRCGDILMCFVYIYPQPKNRRFPRHKWSRIGDKECLTLIVDLKNGPTVFLENCGLISALKSKGTELMDEEDEDEEGEEDEEDG